MEPPKSTFNDCVVGVFREITGEDETTARNRFLLHLTGEAAISWNALRSCLADVGRVLTPCGPEVFNTFGEAFQGEAVVFYAKDADPVHVVLVRSGGIVFDPHAPDGGEPIKEYLKRIGGETIAVRCVSMVV